MGLPTSSGNVPISNFLGYGPGPAQLVPGMNPWSVNWTDLSGNHHTDPLNINCHCFDATTAMVLNPAAWTNVPNGRFVANESSIRSFRGIRVEFTNIFNRFQLPTSATAPGGSNLGTVSASTTFTTGSPRRRI